MSIFPTKILLATDGSEEAELAFASAADLSKKTGSELHVVYVGHMPLVSYESPGATTLDPGLSGRMHESAQHEARRMLDEQMQRVGQSGDEIAEVHARIGKPAAEIVGLAEELGAGLIVLGSRGLGRLRRALMGSVSDSVVRHAHCPKGAKGFKVALKRQNWCPEKIHTPRVYPERCLEGSAAPKAIISPPARRRGEP